MNFSWVRKRCLNKNSVSRWWFCVHMRQFHFDFYCFFDFLDPIFFLNGFPIPFIVHSRLFFVSTKFSFLASDLLSTCIILTLIFFFLFFLSDFRNDFTNSLIVSSRSSFLFSQWKFFELYFRQDLSCYFFNYFSLFLIPQTRCAEWFYSHACNNIFISVAIDIDSVDSEQTIQTVYWCMMYENQTNRLLMYDKWKPNKPSTDVW